MSDDPDVFITAVYENRRAGGTIFYKGPNTRYKEHLLDGLRVYHNPYADYPLDPELFGRNEIFQATSAGVADLVSLCPATRLLVCHQGLRVQPEVIEKIIQEAPPEQSFWYSVNAELYRESRKKNTPLD